MVPISGVLNLVRCSRFLVLILLTIAVTAAKSPPAAVAQANYTGWIEIGLAEGTVRGDVCVTGFPDADTLHVALNSALRIRSVNGRLPMISRQRAEPGGATTVYTMVPPVRDDATQAPLCVRYDGSETVYEVGLEHYRETDESSLLAFNGKTFRARGASRWLPTPFDPRSGLAQESGTFDLQIRCAACALIFVNGSEPAAGPLATVHSLSVREPLLIAGDLRTSYLRGVSVIADGVTPAAAELLILEMERIRAFFEESLRVPYGPLPDLVLLPPVRAPRRGQLWGFFSDPTFTILGMSLDQLMETLQTGRASSQRSLRGFLAHEMAHRYFGWTFGAESPQRDLFGEPFATLLELRAVRHFHGNEPYSAALRAMMEQVGELPTLASLEAAGPEEFSYPAFRYGYAPLALSSLERFIGEEIFGKILRDLLSLPPEDRASADFGLIRELAVANGVSPDLWRDWVRRCLPVDQLVLQCGPFIAAGATTAAAANR